MKKFNNIELNSYCEELRKCVLLVGKNTEEGRALAESYHIPYEEAHEKYNFMFGENLYDFEIKRPSESILDAYALESGITASDEELCNETINVCGAVFNVFVSKRQKQLLELEQALFREISTGTCQVMLMHDDRVLLHRNFRRIYTGSYRSQEEFDICLREAQQEAVIDWESASLYIQPVHSYFCLSDTIEPSYLCVCEDDLKFIPELPFRADLSVDEISQFAEDEVVRYLKAGGRPRYMISGARYLNALEPGKEYPKDLDFGGFFDRVYWRSGLLEIEDRGDRFYVKQVYNSHTKKPAPIGKIEYKNRCDHRILDSLQLPSDFVGIDFETLYAQRVSACSVGMVKYRGGKVVDRYYSLIRPPFDYPGKSGYALTWVHGFTEAMLKDERDFTEVLPEMEAFAEGLPLVAHNACVERACIHDAASFYGLTTTLDYNNIIDTLPLSRRVEKVKEIYEEGPGTHSLDAVCRRFGVPEMCHHNALDDAEMCGNLLAVFNEILDGKGLPVVESSSNSSTKKTEKYKAEDKVQRTDMENVVDNPFKDCAVVVTGFSSAQSQEYGHILKELGAKVCGNVTGKTKWLICGSNAGPSKIAKATEIGANIISEEDFLKMIKTD